MRDPLYFTVDDVIVKNAVQELSTLMLNSPEMTWAALVDGAFDYPTCATTPYARSGINCFASAQFEGLEKAAPWLVPLTLDATLQQQLTVLLRHCQGRPMLSFAASRISLHELRGAWQGLHMVNVIDHQQLLLRFADTRVLAALPSILDADQWASISSPLADWVYYDRTARLSRCPVSPRSNASIGITLNTSQLDQLLQISHPDAMLAMILESMPDIVPEKISRSRRYALVADSHDIALQHGIKSAADVFSLAVAALLSDGASNMDDRLFSILRENDWAEDGLGEHLVERGIL